ncbi:MAG TPA: response regulator [Anaerolineae bacterium]|nr:response regulator [Anaerolineae bacterium]
MKEKSAVKVLVVEDDFMVSNMIEGKLGEIGYRVAGKAATGCQAIELVEALKPDVVLMDIEMPDMDGIEATRLIYENHPTPVVMLTAYDAPDLVRRASAAGAGAYLLKLPQARDIERAITVALARFADMMELRRLNAELDAFAHTVAHGLKNPLSLVISYADLLKNELRLNDEQHRLLNAMARNAHRMEYIIESLLLLAGVRQTEPGLTPLNMSRIVAEAGQRLTDVIERTQAQIFLPEQWPVALGYAPWIEEVWTNYISNGLKYGGTPPRLQLGATARSDGKVRFWIRDNGAGLAAEERALVFAPFTRLHQTRAPGSGLGLSIVKRIVEKLGGQVGVESEGVPGRGCTFYFTLPQAEVPDQPDTEL